MESTDADRERVDTIMPSRPRTPPDTARKASAPATPREDTRCSFSFIQDRRSRSVPSAPSVGCAARFTQPPLTAAGTSEQTVRSRWFVPATYGRSRRGTDVPALPPPVAHTRTRGGTVTGCQARVRPTLPAPGTPGTAARPAPRRLVPAFLPACSGWCRRFLREVRQVPIEVRAARSAPPGAARRPPWASGNRGSAGVCRSAGRRAGGGVVARAPRPGSRAAGNA